MDGEEEDKRDEHDNLASPTCEDTLIPQTVVSQSAAGEVNERAPVGNGEADEELTAISVRYVADLIMNVFAPVCLCMVLVVIALASPSMRKPHEYSMIRLTVSETATPSLLDKIYMSISNVVLILVIVISETFLLVLAIAKGCNRLISAFLTFATAGALMTGAFTFTNLVSTATNSQIDLISYVSFTWNLVVVGVVSLQFAAPIFLQHVTQICMSASMAVTMIRILPPWTTWLLLVALIIYDVCAVLLPWGPLNLLIKQVTKKNQGRIIGGLAYAGGPARRSLAKARFRRTNDNQDGIELRSADAVTAPDENRGRSHLPSNQNNAVGSIPTGSNTSIKTTDSERRMRNREKNGIQLGLGDFVFYSILVGETVIYSDSDWTTTTSCFVIILSGMLGTIGFLLLLERPLPALPISLTIGLVFYFIFFYIVKHFVLHTQFHQIFI